MAIVVLAGFTAGLAVALLLGDQSPLDDSDRAIRPIALSPTAARAIGAASMVVTVGAIALVIRRTRSAASAGAWTLAMVAFVAAGAFAGLVYAAGTAKVVGANIGYGILASLAVAVVPIALTVGLVSVVRGCRKDNGSSLIPTVGAPGRG